jgi:ketosteroid isomerase-like protein
MQPMASTANSEADDVRATEREHIRALVNGDLEAARQLHADDFQLVTPLGVVFSKEQYLAAVTAGDLHYLACEFESPIEVRMYTEVALIRYQSQIEIVVQGQKYPRARYWHTNAYERRGGRWQLVWSQATAIT